MTMILNKVNNANGLVGLYYTVEELKDMNAFNRMLWHMEKAGMHVTNIRINFVSDRYDPVYYFYPDYRTFVDQNGILASGWDMDNITFNVTVLERCVLCNVCLESRSLAISDITQYYDRLEIIQMMHESVRKLSLLVQSIPEC